MTDTLVGQWIAESDENKRLFAEEALIIQVTEAIWEAMEVRGCNKSQLAEALGKSKAFVTQLLSGSRNMTLRTLADIASALDQCVKVEFCEDRYASQWESSVEIRPVQMRVVLGSLEPVEQGRQWSQPRRLPDNRRRAA